MNKEDILKRASDILADVGNRRKEDKEKVEKERRDLVVSLGKNLAEMVQPAMAEMAAKGQMTKSDLQSALREALHDIKIDVPQAQVNVPSFDIPTPQVTINVPDVIVPPITVPASTVNFPAAFKALLDYDRKNPMPVMMVDPKGNPFYEFGGGGSHGPTVLSDIAYQGRSLIDGTTTPGQPALRISGTISAAAASSVTLVNADGTKYDSDNPLPVTFSAASVQPVSQVSGASWSTVVNEIFGTTGTNAFNPDNRLKVELPTGASGLTDTELRAATIDIKQVSGASDSVNVLTFNGNTPATGLNETTAGVLRVVQMSDVVSSVSIGTAFSGADGASPNLIQFGLPTNGYGAMVPFAFNGATYDRFRNSTGEGGGLRIQQATDSISSVYVTGFVDSAVVFQARTTNPTAKSDGADVRPSADKLGRTITRPIQMRDLTKTAYVALANGTETALITASAGTYNDLVMITATNNSTVATQLDIRATTAGNIIHTMYLPASTGPVGFVPAIPWPQDSTGNSWTVDMPDQTGTTVYVSALFSQEL